MANHQMSQALLSVQTFGNNSIYQFDSCTQHSFTSSDASNNGLFGCPKMKHCCRKYPAEVTDCPAPPMFILSSVSRPRAEDPHTSHNLQTHSYAYRPMSIFNLHTMEHVGLYGSALGGLRAANSQFKFIFWLIS